MVRARDDLAAGSILIPQAVDVWLRNVWRKEEIQQSGGARVDWEARRFESGALACGRGNNALAFRETEVVVHVARCAHCAVVTVRRQS